MSIEQASHHHYYDQFLKRIGNVWHDEIWKTLYLKAQNVNLQNYTINNFTDRHIGKHKQTDLCTLH